MPKGGVLGNDPFRRGAAVRGAEPEPDKAPGPPKQKPERAPKRTKKAKARGAAPEQPLASPQVPAPPVPAPVPVSSPPVRGEPVEPPAAPLPSESSEEIAEAVARAARETEPDAAPAARTTLFDHMAGEQPAAPMMARALGAIALARNVAARTLKTEGIARLAKIADGVFSAVMTAVGASGAREVDPYGKDEELARKLAPISDFFYDRYWRVTVEGAPLVPAGASILVANHSGAIPIDGFILHQALHKERPDLTEARWLTEDQIFHAPFLGTLYNRLGAIRASPENAVRLLREGRPVITFPEGVHGIRKPFQERYQLKRLGRGGFAKIAIRERIPIVPVAIVGAEEAMPLLGKLPGELLGLPYIPVTVPPLPAHWYIRFGEPILVDALPPEAADDLLSVQRLVERTRESIEGMIRALLQDRRSVFGG